MDRLDCDETKIWEKTRERTATEMIAIRQARWDASVPEEALPYLHNVSDQNELFELGQALRQCMPLVGYIRALTELRRAYGDMFDASGLKTRPSLSAVG